VRTTRLIPLAPLAVAAVLAGCGSSNSSSSAGSAATTSSPPTTSTGAAASSAPKKAAAAALITTKHDKLGTILAYGPKRLTVYLFEADRGPMSSCVGACAVAWPPVLGTPKAAGAAVHSNLSTIRRANGTMQVAYKGHPLYLFVKDKDDEDAYGEGVKAFGAEWYVLNPAGAKIDDDENDKS
jgi:predicted lipoprotein with Yx(FWY)xxD motif